MTARKRRASLATGGRLAGLLGLAFAAGLILAGRCTGAESDAAPAERDGATAAATGPHGRLPDALRSGDSPDETSDPGSERRAATGRADATGASRAAPLEVAPGGTASAAADPTGRAEAASDEAGSDASRALAVVVFAADRHRRVQGASVTLVRAFSEASRVDGATTDADGVAILRDVAPAVYMVVARHSRRGVGSVVVDLRTKREDLVPVVLGRGGRLEGEVEDEAGAPVAGARVSVGELGFAGETATDAFGRFVLDGILRRSDVPLRMDPDGPLQVQYAIDDASVPLLVEAEGFAPWAREVPVDVPVKVTLRRPRRVRVRVFRDGEAVAGAEVRYEGWVRRADSPGAYPETRAGSTDEDGRVVLEGLHGYQGTLRARYGEARSLPATLDLEGLPSDFEVTLGIDVPTPVRFRVTRASDGAPIPEAPVHVAGRPGGGSPVRTDGNGVAETEVLWGGRRVSVWMEGYAPFEDVVEVASSPAQAPQQVDLVLQEAASLAVRVVWPSGVPVANARVRVSAAQPNLHEEPDGFLANFYRSDDDGWVTVRNLGRGTADLSALLDREDGGPAFGQLKDVAIPREAPLVLTVRSF